MQLQLSPGDLRILNVGKGDTKLTFNPEKPVEREQAKSALTEMIRLGFSVMVQVGERDGKPLYQRCEAFDPETHEYIIVGVPDGTTPMPGLKPDGRKGRHKKHRLPAGATSAVAVAPTAGG